MLTDRGHGSPFQAALQRLELSFNMLSAISSKPGLHPNCKTLEDWYNRTQQEKAWDASSSHKFSPRDCTTVGGHVCSKYNTGLLRFWAADLVVMFRNGSSLSGEGWVEEFRGSCKTEEFSPSCGTSNGLGPASIISMERKEKKIKCISLCSKR